jgi:murein DD-endopeptidase MepM/ murein hydrolase activator NlpD
MVIPERTRRVHKVVVPFFMLKFGAALCSLGVIFLLIIGIDYIHVLGRIAENKQLKGENFKLRQEIQVIRNKVDSMETTIERVRNYAKKLQILTGQTEKGEAEMPQGSIDTDLEREPASKMPDRHSELMIQPGAALASLDENPLELRVDQLQTVSYNTESNLSRLQVFLLAKGAIASATPSLLPIAGWLSSPFGYRRNPYDGSFRLHAGVDLAADPGTPVRAPAPGMVIFSGNREGYGKVIVINHGYGISTLFAHLSKFFVNSGDHVKRGEIISEVGSTGHSTGPHLHYEIRKNGIPVNPTTFMGRAAF